MSTTSLPTTEPFPMTAPQGLTMLQRMLTEALAGAPIPPESIEATTAFLVRRRGVSVERISAATSLDADLVRDFVARWSWAAEALDTDDAAAVYGRLAAADPRTGSDDSNGSLR